MAQKIEQLNQLKRLAIFATVVELGSFAKASKQLGMNRSAVSEQVAALEAFFETRLLHRTTRSLSLTTDGTAILQDALQIKNSLEKVAETFDDQKIAGRIRVTTTHDFAANWLTPKVIAFNKLNPEIHFDFVLSDKPVNLIEEQIDLAFRIGSSSPDSSLIIRPLFRERLKLYVSPSLKQQFVNVDSVNQLENTPWILLNQLVQNNQVHLVSEKSQQSLSINPKNFHRVDSTIVMIHQIKAEMGIGLGLPSLLEKDLDEGNLIQIFPEWSSEEMNFSILYPSRKHLPARVRTFIDFLLS